MDRPRLLLVYPARKLFKQFKEGSLRCSVGAVSLSAVSDVYADLHLEKAKSNWCGSIHYLKKANVIYSLLSNYDIYVFH